MRAPPEDADPEETARIKAEKDAKNEEELKEAKRIERERHEKREAEWAASWSKRVLKEGDGEQCFAGAVIQIHVTGRAATDPSFKSQRALDSGFKNNSVFDDSRARKVPNLLLIGRGIMVPGLEKAVLSMRVGEHAMVTVKPEGGYGAAGSVSNPVVPGSATLNYDVALLSVDKEEELWELSFERKMELAEERRRRGNALVGAKCYLEADEYAGPHANAAHSSMGLRPGRVCRTRRMIGARAVCTQAAHASRRTHWPLAVLLQGVRAGDALPNLQPAPISGGGRAPRASHVHNAHQHRCREAAPRA